VQVTNGCEEFWYEHVLFLGKGIFVFMSIVCTCIKKLISSLDMISNRTWITYISRVCLLVLWLAVLHWLTRNFNKIKGARNLNNRTLSL